MSAEIWNFAELTRTVLVMSATGSSLALLLFVLKPLIRSRVPQSFQYYMWLAVLLALITPLSKIIVLPPLAVSGGQTLSLTPIYDAVQKNVYTVEEELDKLTALPPEPSDQEIAGAQSPFSSAATIFSIIWLPGLLAFGGYNILGYLRFARKLKKGAIPADAREREILGRLTEKSRVPTPRLYRHALAPTPMLLGVFRPVILLPDRAYADTQLQNILLHELTHWRRRDVAIKWLAILAGAVHWFNPLVYLARRELSRVCELACDEAVIKRLDADGKQHYGDTLIFVAADARLPKAVLSATMCEEKRALKERLGAIMKHSRFSARLIALSCLLVAAVFCGALALGAASPEPPVSFSATAPGGSRSDNPVITLYGYNQRVDNGDTHDIKKHFTHTLPLRTDGETGWTLLTDEIFIDVQIPDGTVLERVYCAETGSGPPIHTLTETKYTPPYRHAAEFLSGNTWRVADFYPGGFMGHIWAVTTDADGVEHYSDIINVCDKTVAAYSIAAVMAPFDNQYIEGLEQGHHTGDLDPENVLAEYIVHNYPDQGYRYGDFELRVDEDRKKVYVHPAENITVELSAYDVTTSSGDVLRVWFTRQ